MTYGTAGQPAARVVCAVCGLTSRAVTSCTIVPSFWPCFFVSAFRAVMGGTPALAALEEMTIAIWPTATVLNGAGVVVLFAIAVNLVRVVAFQVLSIRSVELMAGGELLAMATKSPFRGAFVVAAEPGAARRATRATAIRNHFLKTSIVLGFLVVR